MFVVIIVIMSVSFKDRPLEALLSCLMHASHIAGWISRSDREAE